MKTPIGANVTIRYIDETFHPEHQVETYKSYISFSNVPDFDLMKGNEKDDFGVRDSDILAYMNNEEELQEYMDYPDDSYAIVGYDLVYLEVVISNSHGKHAV